MPRCAAALDRQTLRTLDAEAQRHDRRDLRRARRRHHHARQCRRPSWQIHLLPQKIEKLPYIGTLSILFAASNVVKVPGFLTLGYLTRDNLLVGLTLVPIALLANFVGIWMVRRVSTELFYRIAYVLMFIIAVELIRSSVVNLWWGN